MTSNMSEETTPREDQAGSFPPATCAIIFLLVIVFFFEALFASTGFNPDYWLLDVDLLKKFGALNKVLVVDDHEWWRLAISPFLHAGAGHLFFNGMAMFLIGYMVEDLIGAAWLLGAFALSALAGGIFSLAINPPSVVAVGASGGITGLFVIGALVIFHLKSGSARRQELQWGTLRLLIPTLAPALYALGAVSDRHPIDVAAHLGGAVCGLVLGLVVLKKWRDLPANSPDMRP